MYNIYVTKKSEKGLVTSHIFFECPLWCSSCGVLLCVSISLGITKNQKKYDAWIVWMPINLETSLRLKNP